MNDQSLNPLTLLQQIADDIPRDLHGNVFLTGSLAAAYHFKAQIDLRAVNTKDADLVVHPSGNVESTRQIVLRLLAVGWTRHERCKPRLSPEPPDRLYAIRLYPPKSRSYFAEFLNISKHLQHESRRWEGLELSDGWYGLPSFKFYAVTGIGRMPSEVGIEYAAPDMMALANLLAHPRLTNDRMESAGPMRGLLRCAKDLGRVIAIAWLTGRKGTEQWVDRWQNAMSLCFPSDWQVFAGTCGAGLRELLTTPSVFDEAWRTTDIGLLGGLNVDQDMLRFTAQRLLVDVIEPIEGRAGSDL